MDGHQRFHEDMATALLDHPVATAPDTVTASSGPAHPVAIAVLVTMLCIAIVWVGVTGALMAITSTSTWGAIGVGAYAAFWLGGGFGAIFGSAAALGKDH